MCVLLLLEGTLWFKGKSSPSSDAACTEQLEAAVARLRASPPPGPAEEQRRAVQDMRRAKTSR